MYMQMMPLIKVLHPNPPPAPPPTPPLGGSSKYSEHREQTMLQVVAYRRITTMEKSKTTTEKSGW